MSMFRRGVACLLVFRMLLLTAAARGEQLYNGIVLPTTWPPRLKALPDALPPPPYLRSPPDVIPVDVGRQLFVDDFLVDQTTMTRTQHRPTMFPGNPVLEPRAAWETERGSPMALPLSVFYDPQDEKFKMWYLAGYLQHLCLAVSDDGLNWTRPDLGGGRNFAGPAKTRNLVIDPSPKESQRRYKLMELHGGAKGTVKYRYSANGVDWSEPQWASGQVFDATTWFFNPFRQKWVFSIRQSSPTIDRGRIRRYWEFDDVERGGDANWGERVEDAPLWVGAERPHDAPRPELAAPVQLYRLNCEAYESLLLGTFTIHRGNFAHQSGDGRPFDTDRPKCNENCIGFSRDGFHWHRPDHRPWMGLSERRGDWNWGNMWSCGPGIVVVGDYLYIYAAGRRGKSFPDCVNEDAGGSAGLAFMRRDGFVSMDADDEEKTLVTRTLRFTGKHLFVNAAVTAGELNVEVLDGKGKVIPGFSKANCNAIRTNDTIQEVTWRGVSELDLGKLAGREIKLRFTMTSGRLYSFWFSPSRSGASRGYLTAGGPGIERFRDTSGKGHYGSNRLPLIDIGNDRTVRDENGDGTVRLELKADATDPDGRTEAYQWLAEGKRIASGAAPHVRLPVGRHTITVVAIDDDGGKGYDSVDIDVQPKQKPQPIRNNMVLWLKADAITGLPSGAAVARWPDLSGNRYDPQQTEASRRPVWTKDAARGRPTVRFDGRDDLMWTQFVRGLMLPFSNVTVFVAFNPHELRGHVFGQDFNTLYLIPDGGGRLGYGSGTGREMRHLQTRRQDSVRAGRWHVVALVRSGPRAGESRLFIDGRQDDNGTGLHYHNVNSTAGHIGCGRGGRGFFKGDVAEIIVYAGALSDEDRKSVEGYLSRRWQR